ncbi:MAG: hypothetical protein HXY24_02830 [Rubrivivax sp.]|nr:hypothetical protein [Rubrivivax sp.]
MSGNTLVRVQGAADLQTLLSGRVVCAVLGTDRWQEWHATTGALVDYKRGSGDAVDPTKQVGTWSTSGSGGNTVVTYSYTGGSSYSFTVCRPSGSAPAASSPVTPVAFCGSGNQTNITNASLSAVVTAAAACP